MNTQAIANIVNTNAGLVRPGLLTSPEVLILGNTREQADAILMELKGLLPPDITFTAYEAASLGKRQIRGRTRLAVVQCKGTNVDPDLDAGIARSLYTCAELLGTTQRHLRINEYGEQTW